MHHKGNRRKFLKQSVKSSLLLAGTTTAVTSCASNPEKQSNYPLVISTWNNAKANEAAWSALSMDGTALDAVEAGARVPEADSKDMSVGYGGRPDRDGDVTLDACVMDHKGNYGAVTYLKNIMHPVSVARKVMEETPHVMLSGEGALKFATEQGFKTQDLLTSQAKKEWEEWKIKSEYEPKINIELHDTIGIMSIDKDQNISGACTTSGLGYKMAGRVGDSPIVGAGLFVDNEVGAATATGMGELVLKTLGSFLIVELMRQGASVSEACEEAVMRIVRKQDYKKLQVGFIAIDKQGQIGAYSIQPGFVYTVTSQSGTELIEVNSYIKNE